MVTIELRVMPGVRDRTHVGQPLHAVDLQEREKLLNAPSRMPNRQEFQLHRFRNPFHSVLNEIQQTLPGYVSPHVTFRGDGVSLNGRAEASNSRSLVMPYEYDLFASATYGDHSELLNSVLERRLTLPYEQAEGR